MPGINWRVGKSSLVEPAMPRVRPEFLSEDERTKSGGLRGGNPMNEGLFGTAAPRYADVVVLLEIGMGVALLIGAVLARMRRFQLHAWCQSAIVLLNLVVILLIMVPSFHVHVSPKIPLKLGKAYYALATAHGALGSVTEIAGLYILLAAGTNVLPNKFRVTEYKLWMRSLLVLWWLVLLLGLATYARWYVPDLIRK
jgi:uncharacterized membrane protein YozB (DUF420 family)